MPNADIYEILPASLVPKIRAYAEQIAKKAHKICTRYHVAPDVYDVFIMDVIDMLHAQYRGLCATPEQMQALTDAVPQRSWDKTGCAALCFIAQYYANLSGFLSGSSTYIDTGFLNAVEVCEFAKRAHFPVVYKDNAQPAGEAPTAEEINAEAQRLYYTYAVLTAAEFCGATEDELQGMKPYGVAIPEEQRQRIIAAGLDFQRQRQYFANRTAERAAARNSAPRGGETGALFEQQKPSRTAPFTNRTITQFQNIAYMIGNGIQTADDLPDNRSGKMRPLWQCIEEQRRAAARLENDKLATPAEKQRAADLKADTYAAAQVYDGIQILPQVLKPISSGATYTEYAVTPREFYRIATGAENPNDRQIQSFLRALALIDTQRISIGEITEKTITERDSSGVIIRDDDGKPKRKKVQRTIITNFRPVVATFRTEYEDAVPVKDATLLIIGLHNIIKDGRSGEYTERDGKRLYIMQPQRKYLQIEQYYQFTTEEERTFRAILLSKPKQAEDALLSAVFNYPKLRAEAQQRADNKQAEAVAVQSKPDATDEEKTKAQAEAVAAQKRVKRAVIEHMGRDYDKLVSMFEKAKNCGLITYYRRRSSAAGVYKQGAYGRGFVWEWGNAEEQDGSSRRRRGI